MNRRDFLITSAAVSTVSVNAMSAVAQTADTRAANDEKYWTGIKNQYEVTDDFINLEGGYYGIMSKPVMKSFIENNQYVNKISSYYARELYANDYDKLIKRLAKKLNVDEDELAITRNATEALQDLINGSNKLEEGDSVIYADLDYDSMQSEMEFLRTFRKVDVVKINLPESASYDNILNIYEKALNDNPRCKMLLLTHVSNRTGLIMPVKEITAMAKARGVDVILDAAHSWGQFDFNFPGLDIDFAGFILHKWMGVPIGLGIIYIRKNRLRDVDPSPSEDAQSSGIRMKVHTGTMNFASVMTVYNALDFHESIGIKNIEKRLRFLRNTWVNGVVGNDKVEILTPQDERMHAGMTSFHLKGVTSIEDNKKLMQTLLKKYKLFSAAKSGIDTGAYIRVTPGLYNSKSDMEKLAIALNGITSS